MEYQNTHRKLGIMKVSDISFFLLCIYLALNPLAYIEWIPDILNTITLYGFVGITFCSMIGRSIGLSRHIEWYGVFTIVSFIGAFISPSFFEALPVVTQMIKVLLFLFCFSEVVDTKQKVEKVLLVLSISTFLLYIYLSQTNQLIVQNTRLGNDFMGNANIFSTLFMLGAISTAYFVLFSKKTVLRLIALAVFVAQEFAMALAGGRKFFILPIILLSINYILLQDNKGKKRVLIRGTIIIFALVALYNSVMNVPILYNAIGYRFEGLVNGISGNAFDRSAKTRMEMINTGIKLWLSSPIWGHGTDSFRLITSYGGYSHNNYVELLCNLGVIGFLVYYYYVVNAINNIRYYWNSGADKWFWIILEVCLLVFDYGAVTYYTITSQMLLLLIPIGIEKSYNSINAVE